MECVRLIPANFSEIGFRPSVTDQHPEYGGFRLNKRIDFGNFVGVSVVVKNSDAEILYRGQSLSACRKELTWCEVEFELDPNFVESVVFEILYMNDQQTEFRQYLYSLSTLQLR